MLQKLGILIVVTTFTICGLISCCNVKRQKTIDNNLNEVRELVSIGDDIFEAKQKLIDAGFNIKYGPKFPTASKSYYLMIVDYGVRPNGLDTLKYTIGIEGDGKPISGEIRANQSREITNIE